MTCKGYNVEPHFSWVETNAVINSDNLEEALKQIRYKANYNEEGDIVNVEFIGESYGDEEIFFNALAPYVETGSYLCFTGEDGAKWDWEFRDSKVTYEDR